MPTATVPLLIRLAWWFLNFLEDLHRLLWNRYAHTFLKYYRLEVTCPEPSLPPHDSIQADRDDDIPF